MKARVNHGVVAIAVVVIVGGGIALSAATGWWITESSKDPIRITEGEFAGMPDPGDIRGSYTFGDIEAAFDVPPRLLADAFYPETEDPATFAVKNLEDMYAGAAGEALEIGTDSVRWFVALYTGLPYTPAEDTAMPAAAARLLGDTFPESAADRVVAADGGIATDPDATAGTAESGEDDQDDERLIKGRTTFGELAAWGIDAAAFEAIVGIQAGGAGTSMRDFFADAGVEFSAFKTTLQERVDAQ